MKIVSETGRIAYKFRAFGWYISISNTPMKFKQTIGGNKTTHYNKVLAERRHIANGLCERCRREVSIFGRLYHLLPAGHPGRHEVDNLRFLCNSCYKALVRYNASLDINNNPQKGAAE